MGADARRRAGAETVHRTPASAASSRQRRGRTALAVALLALFALVSIDCLNLIQSEEWVDLSQAPHMFAVQRVKDGDHHPQPSRSSHPDLAAVVVAAFLALPASGLLWRLVSRRTKVRPARPPFRPRLRAPPAAPVPLGTL